MLDNVRDTSRLESANRLIRLDEEINKEAEHINKEFALPDYAFLLEEASRIIVRVILDLKKMQDLKDMVGDKKSTLEYRNEKSYQREKKYLDKKYGKKKEQI